MRIKRNAGGSQRIKRFCAKDGDVAFGGAALFRHYHLLRCFYDRTYPLYDTIQ
jgi:hypothetical protein